MPSICQRKTRRPADRLDPKITLDVGAIIPLYLVAMKCSATSARREAIELLLNYPRWEGLWDYCVREYRQMDFESVYEG